MQSRPPTASGWFVSILIGAVRSAGPEISARRFSCMPAMVTGTSSIPGVAPGYGGIWPVLVPGQPVKAVGGCGDIDPGNPSSRYLNRAAFQDAAPFSLGNVAVLPTARRCGYLSEDLGIEKAFPFREHARAIVGANAQNLFNRHFLTSLSTDIDVPASFGRFSGTSFSRSIQLFARI